MCLVRSLIFLPFVRLVVHLFLIRQGRLSCWVFGLTANSHETLLSCRRPVTLGLHSVALPSEHGTCWILIRMVEWTRLVASLCFFSEDCFCSCSKLSLPFRRLLRCGEFPLEWRIADVTPIPKGFLSAFVCNYRPISITPVLLKVFEGWSLCVLVAFWRDLGSCHLTSTHTERVWVPVMLFWTSSVLVSCN